jgi:hypothetical protein
MTTANGETTTTTMATEAEFDDSIFDTSESLFAALRPHPERAWSSSTLHHTNTVNKPTTTTGNNGTTMMAMEPLDYSCGSLFEPQTALEMWGHDHSYNSSSSLSVADLILNGQSSLQQVLDEETKTALEDHNAKQGAAKSPHHLLHTTNSSANSSTRSRRSSRSSSRGGMPGIKPDSAMSLDLFSNSCMEHSIVLIGDHHHPHQHQQPLPSVHHQPHHQSSISLLPKGAASMIDMVDEDMLVDSFNQSLDFVNNTANHHHNHGGGSNNHHHLHHNLHHHHNPPPPLVARSNHANGNVHPAPGSNSSATASATASAAPSAAPSSSS